MKWLAALFVIACTAVLLSAQAEQPVRQYRFCGQIFLVLDGAVRPKMECAYRMIGYKLIQKTSQGYMIGLSDEMYDALNADDDIPSRVAFLAMDTKQQMPTVVGYIGYRTYPMNNGFDERMATFEPVDKK